MVNYVKNKQGNIELIHIHSGKGLYSKWFSYSHYLYFEKNDTQMTLVLGLYYNTYKCYGETVHINEIFDLTLPNVTE